jgi:ABC-2 type transport system permease protein
MNSIRIFLFGGLTSYRALFAWLSPWVLVPTFVVAPVTQILLFVYIGRDTGTASDEFFVIGNAVQYSAVPCLFATASMIAGERSNQTLSAILGSPAPRLPLILGRSLPVFLNGFGVSVFSLLVGGALVGVRLPPASYPPIALAIAASVFSCTGLGLFQAAIGLRVRETTVLSALIFGLLLIFCGVNIPFAELPHGMAGVGRWLPLTHGLEAARVLAAGGTLAQVSRLLVTELALGTGYLTVGLVVLRVFERQSRLSGSLDRA